MSLIQVAPRSNGMFLGCWSDLEVSSLDHLAGEDNWNELTLGPAPMIKSMGEDMVVFRFLNIDPDRG